MGFRFLHLADLHLETRFGGRPRTRERLRRATREAFERAARHALERELHAVLVAGDGFDDPLLSVQTELAIAGTVRRLAEAGVFVLWAAGNHDPGGEGARLAALGLDHPRVRVFRSARPEAVTVTDTAGRAVGVVVGAGHEGDRESRNLAAGFPRIDGPLPVVGLLHTQVEGARSADLHARYAPSTRADFERADYAYWALGHVHARHAPLPGLPVHYAGNLQGRSARECGPKGGLEVEAEPGLHAEPAFVAFAPVRWEALEVSDVHAITGLARLAEHLGERIALACAHGEGAGRPEELALVLELVGPSPLAARLASDDAREELAEELRASTGAIEIEVRTSGLFRPRDLKRLRETPSVLARALELVKAARADDDLLARIAPAELASELDGEPGSGAHAAGRRAYLRELLAGMEHELVERCVEEGPA